MYNNSSVQSVDLELIERLFNEKESYKVTSFVSPIDTRKGFRQLKRLIADGLNGNIQPGLHILSADCGSGKSRKVQESIKNRKSAGFTGSESLLICLATLDEIDSYIDGSGMQKTDYAVVSSDYKFNGYGMGQGNAGLARIVFTTHEQFDRRVREHRSFKAATQFHYQGKSRSFGIWDEAYYMVKPVSFSVDALRALPDALIGCPTSVVDAFRPLIPDSDMVVAGGSMMIPPDIGPFADQATMACRDLSPRHKTVLDGLRRLAGSVAQFKRYGARWSIIGASLPLPDDLPPMIVLDASARLTDRYERMERHGLSVHMLDPVVVDYSNLTIRWIDLPTGKEAFKDADKGHLNWLIAADLANAKLQEEWLLGCVKGLFAGTEREGTPPVDLASMLTDRHQCSVVTWGKHHGSNAYRNIRNVIVMGAWDYPGAAYDAIHLAKGGALDSEGQGNADARDMEFMSNIFQMVCRSNVRNHVNGVCGEATVYLIMPTKGGRRDLVEKAFPGCRVESYLPPSIKPRTIAQKIIAAFDKLFRTNGTVSIADLRMEIGSDKRSSYFTKPLKSDEVVRYMKRNYIRRIGNNFVKLTVVG